MQAEASSAAYLSWKQRTLVAAPNHTFADGLATGSAFELPQAILWDKLDDFLLVSEEQILQSMVWMIERAHTLAESAGSARLQEHIIFANSCVARRSALSAPVATSR